MDEFVWVNYFFFHTYRQQFHMCLTGFRSTWTRLFSSFVSYFKFLWYMNHSIFHIKYEIENVMWNQNFKYITMKAFEKFIFNMCSVCVLQQMNIGKLNISKVYIYIQHDIWIFKWNFYLFFFSFVFLLKFFFYLFVIIMFFENSTKRYTLNKQRVKVYWKNFIICNIRTKINSNEILNNESTLHMNMKNSNNISSNKYKT